MSDLLGIYLNDHLAGSTAGLELVKRARGSNKDTPLGDFLAELTEDIDADREALRAIMRELGVGEDNLKKLAGYVGEKVGRLKLNGHVFSHSPLSRVIELEGLLLGVTGKRSLWRALGELGDPRLDAFDFVELEARAQSQIDGLEEHRLAAAQAAFLGEQ